MTRYSVSPGKMLAVFFAAVFILAVFPSGAADSTDPLVIYGDISYKGSSFSSVEVEATNTRTDDTLPGEINDGSYTVTFGGPGHEWEIGDTIHIIARGTGRYSALRAEATYEIADGEPERVDLSLHSTIDADFSYDPQAPLAGENVSFTAVSSPKITNYTWDFGDDITGYGRTVVHVYQSPGNYTAKLTVAAQAVQASTSLTVSVGEVHTNDTDNDTTPDDGDDGGDENENDAIPGFSAAVFVLAVLATIIMFKRLS